MAYRVDKFNGTFLTAVEDGTIDTTTDIRFVGKNYAGYGEVQNENFLHLLENFANTSAPPRAIRGQIWYDTENGKVKFYDGTRFKTASGAEVSTTAPAGLSTGDFWYDASSSQVYVWTGSEFVLVGPEAAPDLGNTSFTGQIVKNSLGSNENIARLIVGDQTIGIISATEFTLDSQTNPIAGFDDIKKGFNLINTPDTGITDTQHYFWGTSSNSLKLNGFSSDDFILAGEVSFDRIVSFDDDGFILGDQNDLKVFVSNGDEAIIRNQLSNPIRMQVRISDSDIREPLVINTTGVVPGTTSFYDLGSSGVVWNNVYSNNFIGDVTGDLVGNTTGIHKGNVLADDDAVLIDSSTKTFTGIFSGTLNGTVIGELVGTANNAITLGGLTADASATPSTIVIRDGSGNIFANSFEGTALRSDRLKIDDSASDTDPDYKSAKTTATANTIAARNGSGDLFANVFRGTATSARFADLAEIYSTETQLDTGSVVSISTDQKFEMALADPLSIVAGVISENPAYLMNAEAEGQPVALKGRVPVKVFGPVRKGDAVKVYQNGLASIEGTGDIVGVALETNEESGVKLVECFLKV